MKIIEAQDAWTGSKGFKVLDDNGRCVAAVKTLAEAESEAQS